MSPVAASFIFFIAGLTMQVSGTTVDNCNLTYFISKGYDCQGQMVTNLKNNPSTNCSYEFASERTCLKNHIASCLTNLAGYVDPVTSLLIHQVYHCGDLKYEHSVITGFILNMIKCDKKAFMDTEFCWRYFRERLNANRTDPLLCREYAVAKKCIREKARANCKICEELPRDTFNPFCANNTDPEMHRYGCQDIRKPLACTAYTVYKIAGICEETLLKACLVDKGKPDCGTTHSTMKKCLDEKLAQMCPDVTKNQWVVESIQKAVLAVLRGHRFFCEPVNLRAINLDFKARSLYPCSAEFSNEMEKCSAPVRKEFELPKSSSAELCRRFRTAVECSSAAQKSRCNFNKETGDLIQYPYTKFCTDYHPKSDATSLSTSLCFIVYGISVAFLHDSCKVG